MFHNEKLYKNFEDFVQNSEQSKLAKKRVEAYYPDKIPEYFTYIGDESMDYNNLDDMYRAYRYLFKYWWVTKQLEEC